VAASRPFCFVPALMMVTDQLYGIELDAEWREANRIHTPTRRNWRNTNLLRRSQPSTTAGILLKLRMRNPFSLLAQTGA
jgi:hypothetical protein